jgi:DNA-binding NarL/FixJ family response regulator
MIRQQEKRIVLIESDSRVRAALRMLFSYEPEITIVAESPNAQALPETVKEHKPDIILLDWESAVGCDHHLLSTLRRLEANLHIIVLSGRSESEPLAIRAGADVFVSKTDTPDTLLGIVRALANMNVQ